MRHSPLIGISGVFCIQAELPSLQPDISSTVQIFDASSGRRMGNYNSLMSPLRSWSWNRKVLPKKVSANYLPLFDPTWRGYFWYMMPCGEGINRLSPSDSFLAGNPAASMQVSPLTLPEAAGGSQLSRYIWGESSAAPTKVLLAKVPIPEADMSASQIAEAGEEPTIAIGFWYLPSGAPSEIKIEQFYTLSDRTPIKVTDTKTPLGGGWQRWVKYFKPSQISSGKSAVDFSISVSGSAFFTRPFTYRANPEDPGKPYTWKPGEAAYRVAIQKAQRWTHNTNVDYLDLDLVEVNQSLMGR